MRLLFFLSAGLLAFATIGYPIFLLCASAFRRRPVIRKAFSGKVSFIITAHNEEANIRGKIKNTLEQDFPRERLEILVASDYSTDHTDEIVLSFVNERVVLVRSDHRGGKEYAQLNALKKASGDVVIFSDVATKLDSTGVRRIVSNFADPTVGCVSSRIMTTNPDGRNSGEGIYLRYEMFLRQLESRANSIIGLSGSFFAARADVCSGLRHDTDSDFQALLSAVRMGYRGVIDPESRGYYQDIAVPQKEFNRRIRTVLRGMTTLLANLDLLNPLRHPLFAFQLITHKLLRWLMPVFLFGILLSSLALSLDSQVFRVLAGIEVGGCILGLLAVANAKIASISPMHLLRYAVLTNLGILLAWLKFLRGERVMFWEPSKR